MKIHLVRSEEISTSRFGAIAEIIRKTKGPIDFIVRKQDITETDTEGEVVFERQILSWDTLFGECEDFRRINNIPSNELVCFLTDNFNEKNWFSSWDPSGKMNFFVQTSDWDDLVEGDSCYPIIYELATIPLYTLTCENLSEVEQRAHQQPRGCPFDFCRNKNEVLLRLRTGDICSECRDVMEQKNVDPAISKQIFKILDNIRSQILFRERSQIIREQSPLVINTYNRKLKVPGFLNNSVVLQPMEMALYLFFLMHVEGVAFRYMQRHKEELRKLYSKHCGSDYVIINARVDNITTNNKDLLSQLILRINDKIANIVPPGLKEMYQITGEAGEKRLIKLDRKLVRINVHCNT